MRRRLRRHLRRPRAVQMPLKAHEHASHLIGFAELFEGITERPVLQLQ